MAISLSRFGIRQRPSVRAMQTGGYGLTETPNPNTPAQNVNNYASSSPTHVNGMSAQEFNSMNAERGKLASEEARADADKQGGLTKVTQGIRSVPSSRRWDALFGALQNAGADRLQTGAVSFGDNPGFFDEPSISALQQQRAGSLDAFDVNRAAASFQNLRRLR